MTVEKLRDSPAAASTSIRKYFSGKEMLVTGATGFVARVLIEKVLRDLPEIGRIHVLIRPSTGRSGKTETPDERLHREVLGSTAFDRLREVHGEQFDTVVRAKVSAVAGDLSAENLGLDLETSRRLQSTVKVIVNSAGVVSFDASLQAAYEANTMGPVRVMEFARGCQDAVFAHVSTCYVNGTRQGVVPEEPLDPNRDMTAGGGPYDVDEEAKAINRLVEEVDAESFSHARQREFEKASSGSEHGGQDGPTTVESLRKAWVDRRMEVEGMRWAQRRGWNDTYTFTKAMGEQMIVRHRGDVPTLIYRPSIIESAFDAPEPGWLDGYRMIDPLIVAYGMGQLPDFPGSPDAIVDMVPVDMVVNSLLASIPTAHRSSDVSVYQLATSSENPLTLRRFCDVVREHFIETPLRSRSGAAQAPPRIGLPPLHRFMRRLRIRYLLPLRTLEALTWFTALTPQGRRLRRSLQGKRASVQKLVYYAKIYSPYSNVLCQYQSDKMRSVLSDLNDEEQATFNFDVKRIDWQHYVEDIHIPGIKRFLLGIAPKDAVAGAASAPSLSARRQALISEVPVAELRRWSGLWWPGRPLRQLTHWLWGLGYRYYLGFHYDGLERVPKRGPFIVVANHTSHLDTGALLVLLGGRTECLHPVAAKDYWFRDRLWTWLSRTFINAIPFDRHANFTESLRLATAMLKNKHALLYFPEGGRSVTGEIQTFKAGLGVLAMESGAPIVPAKISGSYEAMAKGMRYPRRHRISVRFGEPISVEPYLRESDDGATQEVARKITEDAQRAVEALP